MATLAVVAPSHDLRSWPPSAFQSTVQIGGLVAYQRAEECFYGVSSTNPDARMMGAQYAMSLAMIAWSCCGVVPVGSIPRDWSRLRTFASRNTCTTDVESDSIECAGAPVFAKSAVHPRAIIES